MEEDNASDSAVPSSQSQENLIEGSLFMYNREWMLSKKKLVEQKLISLHKLKKKRMQNEKSAAVRLERTVCIVLFSNFYGFVCGYF